MRPATLLALLMASCGLTGCAKEWSRPNTTEAELNMDQLACEQEALNTYPVVHDPTFSYRPPAPSKLDTNCVQQSGFNNCNAAGSTGASTDAHSNASDYNRAAAVRACLTSRGYSYKKVAR